MLDKRLQPAWDLLTEAGASFPDYESRLNACKVIARALEAERRRADERGSRRLSRQVSSRHVEAA